MHAAYRVIGPSAAGDRHFGVVFQRIFSASPGVPPALDRQRTARRRRRRERPYPRGLREGRLPGADEPGAPRAARVAAGGSPRADHARARHQLPLDRRLGAARGGLCGRASRRAPFPANSHPFTATRLVPGADVLAPGPAALPLPVGLLLRHRLRERRARRAPARNVRRRRRTRALPGERGLAEQRDRPSQAWAARGRARAGPQRTPRRSAGDHWGELQSVVISAALIASAFVVDGRYNIDRLELAATVLIPVGLLGSCVAKQAPGPA